MHGNPYMRATGGGGGQTANIAPHPETGGGGGGAMRLTLPDLRWNVALLNAAAVLFLAAMVGMFLWMVDRIDDKFETLSEPLQQVRESVAAQGATLEQINAKIDGALEQRPTPSENAQSQQNRENPSPITK